MRSNSECSVRRKSICKRINAREWLYLAKANVTLKLNVPGIPSCCTIQLLKEKFKKCLIRMLGNILQLAGDLASSVHFEVL